MTFKSLLCEIRQSFTSITIHLTVLMLIMTVRTAGELYCTQAQQNCLARTGCSMAMRNYLINCGEVIHGEIEMCPSRCKKALISLLSTEEQESDVFMKCKCNGSRFCITQKERMKVCHEDVLTAMESVQNESTVISCSLAEQICKADTSCLAALSYFGSNCGKLETGEKCTLKCNNSLSILFRQTKAQKLRTCICDGTESYPCAVVHKSIQRLCYHGNRRHRHGHHHHNHTRGHGGKHKNGDGEEDTTVQDKNGIAEKQKPSTVDCSNTSINGNSIQCFSRSIAVISKPYTRTLLIFVVYIIISISYQ